MNQDRLITVRELTREAFAPFGDILDCSGEPTMMINQGWCERYHDLAKLDFAEGGPAISLFSATPRQMPYEFDLVERHPLGSQAFIPMSQNGFLIIVAENGADDTPSKPMAFMSKSAQAINFHRNTWHGVLTPLNEPGLFAVVDRIGQGNNLEEFSYDQSWSVIE